MQQGNALLLDGKSICTVCCWIFIFSDKSINNMHQIDDEKWMVFFGWCVCICDMIHNLINNQINHYSRRYVLSFNIYNLIRVFSSSNEHWNQSTDFYRFSFHYIFTINHSCLFFLYLLKLVIELDEWSASVNFDLKANKARQID